MPNGLDQNQDKTKSPLPLFFFSYNGRRRDSEARMVVLRNFDATQYHFTIYTDARTPKMKSLALNPKAELLFYDHKKLLQIRVKAICIKSQKDAVLFSQQHNTAQKDYTTQGAPGTPITGMNQVVYTEEDHFNVLVFKALAIDYLRLKRPNHQRALFSLKDKSWKEFF